MTTAVDRNLDAWRPIYTVSRFGIQTSISVAVNRRPGPIKRWMDPYRARNLPPIALGCPTPARFCHILADSSDSKVNLPLKNLLPWLLGGVLSFLPLSFAYAATAKPLQLIVLASSATMGAFQALSTDYEKRTGVRLVAQLAPSTGNAPYAIANRMARQEPADVVLLSRPALERLIKDGHADADSRVELGKAFIALAVPAGAPKPDISTMENFRQTLLDASSIAYSDSSSGLYVSRVMFNRMHIADRVQDKSRMISTEPVGDVLARGEAQVGFQQLSELKQANGIQIVGLIPDQAQQMTLYCGAVASRSNHPQDAQALLDYLASSEAAGTMRDNGLEPMK